MLYYVLMDAKDTATLDLGSFDFTPDWAKKAAGVSAGKFSPEREEPRAPRAEGRDRPRTERKPFGDRRDGPRPPRDGARSFGDRRERPRFEPPKPLDVDVKILPETKALGTIMRKLQQSAQAFKLKDLAYFLLDNPASVLLKITPKGETPDARLTFHQCKACSYASTKRDDVINHILGSHIGDYYEAREIEVEPPKGTFTCVAKCGLTGELLGPPNVHEFNSVVREMLRTRFPNMREADYRAKIEMVRDAETIETWRKGATKKTVFVAKGAGADAPQLTREQAEGEFRRTILDNLLDAPKTLMMTAEAALKSDLKPLVWAVRDALQLENRAPYNMLFALRGAFHHRKMKFFRANDARGPEFVIGHDLREFDASHAIPELARTAAFIAQNPCCTKAEILAADPAAEAQLAWLVSTGHVVSFTNGVFSAVEKFPKYGPQWRNKKKDKAPAKPDVKAEEPPAPEAPAAETPAPETPVAEAPAPEVPVAETPAPEAPASEAPVAEPVAEEVLKKDAEQDETAPQLAE